MSTYDTITVIKEFVAVSLDFCTGSDDDPDQEISEIERWNKKFTPVIEELTEKINRNITGTRKEDYGTGIIIYDKDLKMVWEEETSDMDVPHFLMEGNRPCIYRMRFFGKFPDYLIVSVTFSVLPEKEVRDRLKDTLSSWIDEYEKSILQI